MSARSGWRSWSARLLLRLRGFGGWRLLGVRFFLGYGLILWPLMAGRRVKRVDKEKGKERDGYAREEKQRGRCEYPAALLFRGPALIFSLAFLGHVSWRRQRPPG